MVQVFKNCDYVCEFLFLRLLRMLNIEQWQELESRKGYTESTKFPPNAVYYAKKSIAATN